MNDPILYQFEELSDDLPRPPLVAVRALLTAGIIPAPRGWTALPVETRVALARLGLDGVVDVTAVRELAQQIPPRHLKLVSKSRDPNPDAVPPEVARALGPARPLSNVDWRLLRAVDRAVLVSLAANSRLVARAYDELMAALGKAPSDSRALWSGAIAHCEVRANEDALERLGSSVFLDGQALILARVAGIRAARRIAETFDLHAESATGPVELASVVRLQQGCVVWQAHVSTWDGAFFPAASLLASTTAATALFDMIKELDPQAQVTAGAILEEAWNAGGPSEEATSVYSPARMRALVEQVRGADAAAALFPAPSPEPPAAPEPPSNPGPPAIDEFGKDTIKDVAPPIGSMIASVANGRVPPGPDGSKPLVDTAPVSAPRPQPANVPSVRQPQVGATPSIAPAAPRGLVALFVASLVVLTVAVGIFAYVLARSL
jgi:molybdenum cofactor biosynthesis enzyme